MTDKKTPDLEDEENRETADEGMLHWFEMLYIWLQIDSDAEPYSLKELHSKLSELAGDDSVCCLKRLKQNYKRDLEINYTLLKQKGNLTLYAFKISQIITQTICGKKKDKRIKESALKEQ